jgi:hypothetical protein
MEGTSDHEETAHEYHLHTREALAQSPIVQAMIAEAVEREREACAAAMDDRADYLDAAAKWDGTPKFIASVSGGAFECRSAAAAIRRRGRHAG